MSKDDSIILDGAGDKAMLDERTEQVDVVDVNYMYTVQRLCIAVSVLLYSFTILFMIKQTWTEAIVDSSDPRSYQQCHF